MERQTALDWCRDTCLSLPDASERLSHGAPNWFAYKRCFATFADNVHGDGRLALWLAAPVGAQLALVGSNPDAFFSPPYVGCKGWIGVRLDKDLPLDEVEALILAAHETIAARHAPRRVLDR